ncbi:hypothetical protein BGZ99_008024 [Dissophora globulifera]|uniref:XPA C-terminal domain-containing protein n=1 Tax=Dissophora globulifera TaxID=979702 RepID=A0A9P6UZG2_9FUNG|nr:hypothetical protein BGZ99_008024 [Dissophora globulifera]
MSSMSGEESHTPGASNTIPATSTPDQVIEPNSSSSFSKTTSTSSHATPTSTVAHEETVGRPVARKDLPPDVQAKIEQNRLAALERRAKAQRRLESERAIAWELDGDHGEGGSGVSKSGDRIVSTAEIIEKNAHLLHKAMEAVEPLPKNGWTKFYDYDLSKMKDTRGGFIQELDERDAIGSNALALEEGEEISRKRKWQPSMAQPDPFDLDFQLLRHFHVPVCIGCRDTQPEKYSLLTKTECRMDYLLTDPELRDTELFPFWERPNPRKATWNNMMLYLRCQVEEFAFKKWGGPEGLDREFERRERDKEARKEIKFKKELRDLRNKTRTSVWQDKKMQQRAKVHKHHFGTALVDPESGASVQTCIECGIQVECEEF